MKQHQEGNLIILILTYLLSNLIRYCYFYWNSKVKSIHFHCYSKLNCQYWLAWYHDWTSFTSCVDFFLRSSCFPPIFPTYRNELEVTVTLHLHTSFPQLESMLSLIRIPASSISIGHHLIPYHIKLYSSIQNWQNTRKYTRHAPKWSQLYSDSKIDFSWFLKCLVVLQRFAVLFKEFQIEGPHFLIAKSENIFMFYQYCYLGYFLFDNIVFGHV